MVFPEQMGSDSSSKHVGSQQPFPGTSSHFWLVCNRTPNIGTGRNGGCGTPARRCRRNTWLFLLLALQAPHASSPSTRQRQGLRGLSAGWQHSLQLRTLRGPRVTPSDLPAVLPCSSGPQRSRNPQTRWSQTRCAPRRLQSPERHETTYF